MEARYKMEPHPEGHLLTIPESSLLLRGDRAAGIYRHWLQLNEKNAALADTYLDGVADGIMCEMDMVGRKPR